MSASEFSAASGCSAAKDAATWKRGVQPAAVTARLCELARWQIRDGDGDDFDFGYVCGLRRAVEMILREFMDDEHNTAG